MGWKFGSRNPRHECLTVQADYIDATLGGRQHPDEAVRNTAMSAPIRRESCLLSRSPHIKVQRPTMLPSQKTALPSNGRPGRLAAGSKAGHLIASHSHLH